MLRKIERRARARNFVHEVVASHVVARLEAEEVERIGAREGWRAKAFGRGMQGQKPFFHVIEFWLENRLMIEVATPKMIREYKKFLKNAQVSQMSDPEALRLMRATHIKEPA